MDTILIFTDTATSSNMNISIGALKNNFLNQAGKIIKNADLYKELYALGSISLPASCILIKLF